MMKAMGKYRMWRTASLLGVAALIAGCQHKAPKEIPGANQVLATVNGSPITQFDVDRTAVRLLGPQRFSSLDEAAKHKVLESLVLSRAIAQIEAKQLDSADSYSLDKQVEDYREQLLVKHYLKDHANPKPVTEEMIVDYYNQHPYQFGGGEHKRYQMLFVTRDLSDTERQSVLKAYSRTQNQHDWKRYASALAKQKLPVSEQQGTTPASLPNKTLDDVLEKLGKGKVSTVTFVDGRPYLLQVTDTFTTQPRPLNDVRGQIRRELLPVRIKQALDVVSKQVLGKVKVEYVDAKARN
jgi:hypothetical protein